MTAHQCPPAQPPSTQTIRRSSQSQAAAQVDNACSTAHRGHQRRSPDAPYERAGSRPRRQGEALRFLRETTRRRGAASTAGLSISAMPRTSTKNARAAASSPRGIASCTCARCHHKTSADGEESGQLLLAVSAATGSSTQSDSQPPPVVMVWGTAGRCSTARVGAMASSSSRIDPTPSTINE